MQVKLHVCKVYSTTVVLKAGKYNIVPTFILLASYINHYFAVVIGME